jgi:DNA-directed RNA polymerase specialized sigma24 family protein
MRKRLELFENALRFLSERSREALLMRLGLDLDYSSIAAECGFPSADAARKAVDRAKRRVATEMLRAGFARE